MNAHSPVHKPAFAEKLAPLNAETFAAWKFSTSNDDGRPKVADPVDVLAATTLQEALDLAAPTCWHKDTLAILHTHEGRNRKVLHLYAIKQESKPVYLRNPVNGLPEAIRRRYPVLVVSMEVAAFEPVLRWTYDGDAVGIDANMVEG